MYSYPNEESNVNKRNEFNENKKTSNSSVVKREVRTPRVDMFESDSNYYSRVSLPGVKKEDLKIYFKSSNILQIEGRVDPFIKEEYGTQISQEIFKGPFNRTIQFPKKVNTENIKFNYSSGMLEFFVQKTEDQK
jgi:HSP20 family protein